MTDSVRTLIAIVSVLAALVSMTAAVIAINVQKGREREAEAERFPEAPPTARRGL